MEGKFAYFDRNELKLQDIMIHGHISNIKSVMFKLILLVGLAMGAMSIIVPLQAGRSRCLVVYSVGQSESVKLDIKLPQLADQRSGEFYTITITNTETQEVKSDIVVSGVYKKQLDLEQNIIYEVCMTISASRDLGEVLVQYNSENLFNIEHNEVKVPQSLLKKEDFKNTYQTTYRLQEIAKTYAQMQKEMSAHADTHFVETNSVSKNLVSISAVEIFIVIASGAYQFWTLKNYLTDKQYI